MSIYPSDSPISPDPSTERWLEQALNLPLGPRRTLAVSIPAPLVPVERLLSTDADPVLWDDGRGHACAGVGTAVRLRTSGPRRLRRLDDSLTRLRRTLVHLCHPGTRAPVPRIYGGMSFMPTHPRTDDDPWNGFADVDFVLPRMLLGRRTEEGRVGAYLTVAHGADELARRDQRHTIIDRILSTLDRVQTAIPGPDHGLVAHAQADDARPWLTGVDSILRGIRSGRFHKVVTSRQRSMTLGGMPERADLLGRAAGAGQFRFAFARHDRLFFGRTPERLLRRQGNHLRTEALAGTAASSGSAEDLLTRPKDRWEHELVVKAIRQCLTPLCDSLVLSASPEPHRLQGLVHLRTPIRGRLSRSISVPALVAALHPTPAVGGLDRGPALSWIRQHEPDRGWYASPVGWLDVEGNGELAVALRCGLLHRSPDGEPRLRTFAGAGIVDASDPASELEEIRLKERSFLDAFGFETPEDAP